MKDPQVVNTLRNKADELERHIRKLEKAVTQAKRDQSHINAAIRLMSAPGAGESFPAHFNLGMLFRGRELSAMCLEALASGPKDTRELAAYVIERKGLDPEDIALGLSIRLRVVNAMRIREKRGKAKRVGHRGTKGGPLVWEAV